jgi:acyl-coenzyme A synthetase/AMP-(fatty) acid ligase
MNNVLNPLEESVNTNNPIFWIDEKRGVSKRYNDLIDDLNKKSVVKKFILFSNPYEVFLEIICGILVGDEFVLLDANLSDNEIGNYNIQKDLLEKEIYDFNIDKFSGIDDLFERITKIDNHWKLGFYTSGTTGKPKKVYHSLSSITRNVKMGERFKNNIWAFCYNPTHFAGIQVFFQAFFNRNSMIYIFNLEGQRACDSINKNQITNISATPTFYRSIIPYISTPQRSVTRVTLGGEMFDPQLIPLINEKFPNAKISNIYASTEAGSIFVSHGDTFAIPEQYREYISISNEGELLIHKSLLGESKEFISNDDWFFTGDIIEFLNKNEFRFISRKTEFINVGGYKVNPNEIEIEIKKIEGVQDVCVFGRHNRITGNILIADIIKNIPISDKEFETIIQKQIMRKLQPWKIPRVINFVDNVKTTRTGKKVRR